MVASARAPSLTNSQYIKCKLDGSRIREPGNDDMTESALAQTFDTLQARPRPDRQFGFRKHGPHLSDSLARLPIQQPRRFVQSAGKVSGAFLWLGLLFEPAKRDKL
jgi:hypothetical protein